MASLTIGVHGLAAAEAGLVRALIALAAPERRPPWNFVLSGPCDVLLADRRGSGLQEACMQRGAHALVLLGEGEAQGAATLARPLRSEQLEACLRLLGRKLLGDEPAAAAQQPAAAGIHSGDERRFRLLRWPPNELLRGEPQRVRMASQLSRRYLSAGDLARLTNGDVQRVRTFLQLLQGFTLLEPEPAAARDAAPAPAATLAAPSRLGLVQSIRRRLGL